MAIAHDIYNNVTTNSTSTWTVVHTGGLYYLEVDGIWSSATATFAFMSSEGNAIALPDTGGNAISLTASSVKPVYISPNMSVRGTIVNAGSGTNLSAILRGIPYRG